MPSIRKFNYEEFFRYHDFTPWLGDKNINLATVSVKEQGSEEEENDMVSDVAPFENKKVVYKIKGGISGKTYICMIRIVTSDGQKFEDRIDLKIL